MIVGLDVPLILEWISDACFSMVSNPVNRISHVCLSMVSNPVKCANTFTLLNFANIAIISLLSPSI